MAEHSSRLGEVLGQLGHGLDHALDGERQIRTGVAIGYRIDVEIVDLLLVSLERRQAACKQLPGPSHGKRSFRITRQA